MNIAPAVRTARLAVGWTVRDLAQRSNLAVGTIAAVEKGDRDITLGTASQIAEAFGISPEDLIGLANTIRAADQEKARIELQMQKIALQLINNPS